MVVDVVPYQLLKFGKALGGGIDCLRLMGVGWGSSNHSP